MEYFRQNPKACGAIHTAGLQRLDSVSDHRARNKRLANDNVSIPYFFVVAVGSTMITLWGITDLIREA